MAPVGTYSSTPLSCTRPRPHNVCWRAWPGYLFGVLAEEHLAALPRRHGCLDRPTSSAGKCGVDGHAPGAASHKGANRKWGAMLPSRRHTQAATPAKCSLRRAAAAFVPSSRNQHQLQHQLQLQRGRRGAGELAGWRASATGRRVGGGFETGQNVAKPFFRGVAGEPWAAPSHVECGERWRVTSHCSPHARARRAASSGGFARRIALAGRDPSMASEARKDF
jgi:hypothetical protein